MGIFDRLEKYEHEQLILCSNTQAGLRAVIAIHDTTLGPALGGCRMWTYPSDEDAIEDALRLARGMTYKAAASGLNLGGGKTVIIGDPARDKSEALFRSLGIYIESLNGRYIIAEDVGTTVTDMEIIHLETKYVVGISTSRGGGGDPSLVTAYGVYRGMKACLEEVFDNDSFEGRTVAIQGVGHVGYHLAELLFKDRAKIFAADINDAALGRVVNQFGAIPVSPEEIYGVECDIFAPCALGGIINDHTLALLRCKIVGGSANNQLAEERHGTALYKQGILYAPDYVINAGGLINVADELEGYNRERALKTASKIYDSVARVIAISKRDRIPTHEAADRMAEERIRMIKELKKIYHGHGAK
jgi:leucine dehydrogenase